MSNGLNFNSILNIALTAAGTMFGGPIGAMAAQMFTQIAGGVIDSVIQQVGKEMGLPQSFVDMAQGAFRAALGDTGGALDNFEDVLSGLRANSNPRDYGDLDRAIQELMEATRENFTKQMQQFAESGRESGKTSSRGKGDFFTAMAEAMGKALQKQAELVQAKAEELSEAVNAASGTKDEARADAQNKIMELQTELSAESMRLGYMSTGVHSALTKVGDALSTMGRTQ